MAFWKKKNRKKKQLKKEINYVQRTGKNQTADANGGMH